MCPSYIQDSQNLLQKCENLLIPDDSYLFSCDFESLYSNIDLNLALDKLTEFMKDKLCSQEISLIGFHEILKLVFFNNVFIYNTFFYRQILGIAMGSICGPAVANIFVFLYEKKWLYIHQPIL